VPLPLLVLLPSWLGLLLPSSRLRRRKRRKKRKKRKKKRRKRNRPA